MYVHQVKRKWKRREQAGKILLLKQGIVMVHKQNSSTLHGKKYPHYNNCWMKKEGKEISKMNVFLFLDKEQGICIIGTHVDDIFPFYTTRKERKIRDSVY